MTHYSCRSPVLLLTWKRPQETIQLIDSLRSSRPSSIYIFSDGPTPSDSNRSKVFHTRRILHSAIDWDCSIKRLYLDANLGCRKGVLTALNWFFSSVPEGIVLEDDCIPHPDFFQYCDLLLDRYRDDARISIISAYNQEHRSSVSSDYFFSRLGGIWGWASWQRAWSQNDESLETLNAAIQHRVLEQILPVHLAYDRYRACRLIKQGFLDSWAYSWGYSRLINS